MLKSLKQKENQMQSFGISPQEDSPVFDNEMSRKNSEELIICQILDEITDKQNIMNDPKLTFGLKTQVSEYNNEPEEKDSEYSGEIRSASSLQIEVLRPKLNQKGVFMKIMLWTLILGCFFAFFIFTVHLQVGSKSSDQQIGKNKEMIKLQITNNNQISNDKQISNNDQISNNNQRIIKKINKNDSYNLNKQQQTVINQQNLNQQPQNSQKQKQSQLDNQMQLNQIQKQKSQKLSLKQQSFQKQNSSKQIGTVQFIDSQSHISFPINTPLPLKNLENPNTSSNQFHSLNNQNIQILKSQENPVDNDILHQIPNDIIENQQKNLPNQIQITQNSISQQNYENSLYHQTEQEPNTGNLRHSFPKSRSSIIFERQIQSKSQNNGLSMIPADRNKLEQKDGQYQFFKDDKRAATQILDFSITYNANIVSIPYEIENNLHQQTQMEYIPQPIQIPQFQKPNQINIQSSQSSPQQQPQQMQPFSQMTCPQYILKQQQNCGNLYTFAIDHQLLRDYSHVDMFSDQIITKITRQKFSQAVDLLELVHHVNQQGNILAEDNPCYSADFFKKKMKDLIQRNTERLNEEYQMDSYHNKQLRFCVVVNSYNNAHNGLIYRNIDSILQQNYTNYHVVYTDDNSPDMTGSKVMHYLRKNNVSDQKFNVKINQQKVGMMENIFNAITFDCQEGEIAIMLDGDDSFIGTNVFLLLNAIYQKQRIAMMWNNFLQIEENSRVLMGFSRDLDDYQKFTENFRVTNKFVSSHLKSFYVDLFRKIKAEDLKQDDTKRFFGGASDTAIMFTMIEMAFPNYRYIPEILYEYRFDTGQVGMTVNRYAQQKALQKIGFQKPYQKLQDFSFIDIAIDRALTL